VQEGSPAEKAGFKQGDIIVGLDDQKIKNSNQLRNLVAALVPGRKVKIDVVRDGKPQSISVKVGELPAQNMNEEIAPGSGMDETSPLEVLGARLKNLTPELAKRLKTKQSKGVVVEALLPDGIGALAGLQPGDLILSVNGKRIDTVANLTEALSSDALAKGVRMIVETQGMERFVFLKSEE
jgi:serine protease Do